MNPMISVIVPVYKVEEYLPRCIKSLLEQTYKNFEIILVDDESPDKCPEMCDKYEALHENIRTVHKKNGGLSDARNAGVNIAKGEYITFVDSDDYIHPLYLEMLLKGVKQGAELSVCGFTEVYDNNGIQLFDKDVVSISLLDSKEGLAEILYQGFHDVSAWGILIPLKLVRAYPFPKGKIFEDLYTTYKFFLAVEKVSFIREPLYYYFQREGSIMRRRDDSFIYDLLDASEKLYEACKCEGEALRLAALNKRFSNYCRLVLQPSELKNNYPNQYHKIIDSLKRDRTTVLLDNKARTKNRFAALALFGGIVGLRLAFKFKLS